MQIPKAHEKVVMKLKLLDLAPLRLLFLPTYCTNNGRPGYAPEDMMRTFIAMVLCGIYSPEAWAKSYLQDKHGFYAIISGFLPGEVPSVGCLYDFMARILKLPNPISELKPDIKICVIFLAKYTINSLHQVWI